MQKMNLCDVCRRFKMIESGDWMCSDCKTTPSHADLLAAHQARMEEIKLRDQLYKGFKALLPNVQYE